MPSLRFSIDLEYKIRIREANLLFIVKVFLKYQRLTILNKTKTVSSNIQILSYWILLSTFNQIFISFHFLKEWKQPFFCFLRILIFLKNQSLFKISIINKITNFILFYNNGTLKVSRSWKFWIIYQTDILKISTNLTYRIERNFNILF